MAELSVLRLHDGLKMVIVRGQNPPDGEVIVRRDDKSVIASFKVKVSGQQQDKTFTAELNMASDSDGLERLADHGLIGLKPAGLGVRLSSVRFVVRANDDGQAYASDHPYFAIYFDWSISATAVDDIGEVTTGGSVETVVTTGFSSIFPVGHGGFERGLQTRIDALGVSTGWVSLKGLFDALAALADWLEGLEFSTPPVSLPDWSYEFRLAFKLPLGLAFARSYLILAREAKGYRILLLAEELVLSWDGVEFSRYGDLKLALEREPGGQYSLTAQLFQSQYPDEKTAKGANVERKGVRLPFGALDVSAQAWNVSVGFLAKSTDKKVCPEVVIELYEPRLTSSFAGQEPLWSARAVRLHLVGDSVLTCDVDDPLPLMANARGPWFELPQKVELGSYTEVVSASKDPPPESDPAITFVDGDFDPERIYLRWKQNNAALLEKLRGIVPGLEPAKKPDAGDALEYEVGFELARFGAGNATDLQARLEWRLATADPTPTFKLAAPATTPLDTSNPCFLVKDPNPKNDPITLSLPQAGLTEIGTVDRPGMQLALPVVSVDLQEPDSTAILFFKPADAKPSISLLHVYQFAEDKPHHHQRVVAHAKLDFSIIGGGGNTPESRQSLPSSDSSNQAAARPLIEFAISPRADVSALAVASWTEGQQPKIMRAYRGRAEPFTTLLPPLPGGPTMGCRECPKPVPAKTAPLRLHPGLFGSPAFSHPQSQWQLAMRIAVEQRLVSLFGNGKDDSPVKFNVGKVCWELPPEGAGADMLLPPALIHAKVTLKPSAILSDGGSSEVTGEIVLRFDPSDMSLRMVDGGTFAVKLPIEKEAPEYWKELKLPGTKETLHFGKLELLGFKIDLAAPKTDLAAPTIGDEPEKTPHHEFLRLDLRDGRFVLALAEGVKAYARIGAFGDAGTLTFEVSEFALGSGGLDLEAQMLSNRLKLGGLKEDFRLDSASLSIVGNRMRDLRLSGSGKMPEALDKAPVKVWIDLAQDRPGGRVDIRSLACMLTNGYKISSESKRFEFVLSDLIFTYNRDAPRSSRRFYFEASGSATFAPKEGEFADGLLANLKSATIEFDRAPISDEFIDGLTLVVELRQPKRIELFEVFEMEIRSFGFAPGFEFPSGEEKAALIIGGQARFADGGDVVSGEIDFHRLHIGRAASGEFLPEVSAQGLRVAIETAEGFKIGGSVSTYDTDLKKGFKGSGFVQIPGMPRLGAALGFLELRNDVGQWKRAWFLAIEASGISYQVPPLPVYLRQIGLGFGYRQTHVLLAKADETQDLPIGELLERMLAEIDNYQSLAREESWVDDLEKSNQKPRWTIGLEAVFSLGTSQAEPLKYDPKEDRKYRTAILQTLAAIRSDLTLVAAAKLWFPVAYDDFNNDRGGMRARPLARGFLHYSPRQQRLLVHGSKGKGDIYYGPTKGDDKEQTEFAKMILDPMPFEVTGLIEPSRVRLELGWVDRLVFPLRLGPLKLECRGGMLMALEDDAIVHGLYFGARGELGFSAKAGGGSLGLQASAVAQIRFAARLITVQKIMRPIDSHAYGEIGLDINVRISVKAWLRKKIGFVKIRLSISFSVSIQVVVALQVGWAGRAELGFSGRATIVLRVFGRGLRAKVRVGLNEGSLNRARRLTAPYLDSIVEPGKVPPIPGIGALRSNRKSAGLPPSQMVIEGTAKTRSAPSETAALIPTTGNGEEFTLVAAPVHGTRFKLVWIIPTTTGGLFYPLPPNEDDDTVWQDYATITGLPESFYVLDKGEWVKAENGKPATIQARNRKYELDDEGGGSGDSLSLRQMVAGCYILKQPESVKEQEPLKEPDLGDFPFEFKGEQEQLELPREDLDEVIEDKRIRDGARSADPRLHKGDPFDDALAEAIEKETKESEPTAREKALANQGLLLRSFQSDLEKYAQTLATAGKLVAPKQGDDPGVFDLGMVLVVETDHDDFPGWLDRRGAEGHPEISFTSIKGDDNENPKYSLRPLVDTEAVSFASSRIGLDGQPIVHFDEETLAVYWKMDWAEGAGPKLPGEDGNSVGTVAEGNGTRFEDYLKCYRIEITDLSGSRGSLGTREVVPGNLLGKDGKQLAPRYAVTIPTEELFGSDNTLGQRLRKIELRVTPVNQWDEEGESFVIIAESEPQATPLPADQPQLLLEKATSDTASIMLRWIEPALPNQAGIAATDEWEIVFRPLRQLPYGAFPSEVDAVDEGVAGAAQSSELRAGDLIARLPKLKSQDEPDGSEHFEISLISGKKPVWADLNNESAKIWPAWSLYLGPGLGEIDDPNDAEIKKLVAAIEQGNSPLHADGLAWQIFIRARATEGSNRPRLSSMGRVAMFARSEPKIGKEDAKVDFARYLPMPHFEWPELASGGAKLAEPLVSMGQRHVPIVRPDSEEVAIAYVAAPDQSRVMEIEWDGFVVSEGEAPPSIEAITTYTIHEANLDGMIVGEVENLSEINSFRAADPRHRDELPEDLSDTQNWKVRGPMGLVALGQDKELLGSSMARTAPYQRDNADLTWPEPPKPPKPAQETLSEPLEESTDSFEAQGPGNLNALLRQVIDRLGEAASVEGYALELGYGHAEQVPASPAAWLDQNDAARDPSGWGALWHLGLAVELTIRDPLTGQRLGQKELLKRVQQAVAQVAKTVDEPQESDLRHLAVDLPVRPQEASAAGERQVPDPSKVGLSRIVLMMRPLVKHRDYFWSIENAGAEAVDQKFPEGRLLRVAANGDESIKSLKDQQIVRFTPGDRAVFMGKSELSYSAGDKLLPYVVKDLSEWTDPANPTVRSEPPNIDGEFDKFWELIKAAPRGDAGTELTETARDDAKERYLRWSDRFFGVAPITPEIPSKPTPDHPWFTPRNCATALPDTDALSELSPDEQGKLHYVRVVDGDLASKRKIAIGGHWRYAELNRALAKAFDPEAELPEGIIEPVAGAEVGLDRTRLPAPPQLLRQDTFRVGARQIHRLGFAEHAEARLTNDNALARERLEYRGTRFKFRRSFLHADWADTLKANLPDPNSDPVLPSAAIEWQTIELEVERDDERYLALVPAIRAGGKIVTLPCEPYYYRTDFAFYTMARVVDSVVVERQLDFSEAGPLTARDEGQKLFPTAGPFAQDQAAWKAALEARGVGSEAFLAPCQIAIRLPRFSESLPPDAHPAQEAEGSVVGNLPDRTITMQVVRTLNGTEDSVCAIRARASDENGGQRQGLTGAFEGVAASSEYELHDFVVEVPKGKAWSDGLVASLSLRPVAQSTLELADAVLPTKLHDPATGFDGLVAPEIFPVAGPTAWLGALLLRLRVEGKKLSLARGPMGSQKSLRPYTETTGSVGDDLGIALRLLLDAERFSAAKVVGEVSADIPEPLAQQIEEGGAAAWRKVDGDTLAKVWNTAPTVELWALGKGAKWEKLEEPPSGDVLRHTIAIGDAATKKAMNAFLQLKDEYSAARKALTFDGIDQIGNVCTGIGAELGPNALAEPDCTPAALTVTTQRGNEPRRVWPVRS